MTTTSTTRALLGLSFALGVLSACGDDSAEDAASTSSTSASTTSTTGQGGAGATTGQGGSRSSGEGGEAAACASGFDDSSLRLAVGAELSPGQDVSYCQWWTAPEDVELTGFVGSLGPAAGHHALVIVHEAPSHEDGVGPCDQSELMDAGAGQGFQLLAGVSYESDGVRIDFPKAPVQVGLEIRAGQQVILVGHFLNAGTDDVSACASIDFDRGNVVAGLEFLTVLPEEQYAMELPPQQVTEVSYQVPIDASYRVAAASSHMHEAGRIFRMSVAETGKVLHETTDWADPVPTQYPTEKVILEEGQNFQLDCRFENTSSETIRFPDEMCVGGLYVLPCTFTGACI